MGLEKIFEKAKNTSNSSKNYFMKAALASLLITRLALGLISYKGYIKPSHDSVPGGNVNGNAYLIRNPPGIQDTLQFITNIDGKYQDLGMNFNPPAQVGETLHVDAYKDTNNKHYEASTWIELIDGQNFIYELCLDDPDKPGKAYTVNYRDLCDTLTLTQNLPKYAVSWVTPDLKDTVEVDTLSDGTPNHPHYFDYHINTEKLTSQDSLVPGDTVYTRFYTPLSGDSIAYSDTFAIVGENTFGHAMLGADTVFFPKDIGSTGINEHKKEAPRTQLRVSPTILKGNDQVTVSGLDGYLNTYNSLGQKLDEYKVYGTATIDFSKYPSGVYFLKLEEIEAEPVKVVKTK